MKPMKRQVGTRIEWSLARIGQQQVRKETTYEQEISTCLNVNQVEMCNFDSISLGYIRENHSMFAAMYYVK